MKLHTMKGCLWVNGHIHNPAFDSRTKEDLIACQGSSGQVFEIINYSRIHMQLQQSELKLFES
jgi:hypothetical protein